MNEEQDQPQSMPCAPEAESAAICCVIENPGRFTGKAWEDQISPDYFHSAAKSELWRLMFDRIQGGKGIDPVSLRESVNDAKNPILTVATLHEVLGAQFDPGAWPGYVDTLRDRHARRIAILAGREVADTNADGNNAASILRKAADAASNALQGSSMVMDSKRAVETFMATLKDRYDNGERPGISTGIDRLNDLTGGMRKGELWVIGAKTSGGKSILMIQIAANAVLEGKRVAIFSLEMGVDEVIGRMIACNEHLDIGQILNPRRASKGFVPKIEAGAQRIANTGLFVCDAADLTIDAISGLCQRLADSKGLDLIVIDYLQQITATKIKGQNREQEVANISRACKQLAKRLKCPVLTATQLNEAGQARESRAIENDADSVFIINHGMTKEGTDKRGNKIEPNEFTNLHVWKCRNGKRGEEYGMKMDGVHQKFTFF